MRDDKKEWGYRIIIIIIITIYALCFIFLHFVKRDANEPRAFTRTTVHLGGFSFSSQ